MNEAEHQEQRLRGAPDAGEFLSRRKVARLFGVPLSTETRLARPGLSRDIRTPGSHNRFAAAETRRDALAAATGALTRHN